jgi:hypothetical protein
MRYAMYQDLSETARQPVRGENRRDSQFFRHLWEDLLAAVSLGGLGAVVAYRLIMVLLQL